MLISMDVPEVLSDSIGPLVKYRQMRNGSSKQRIFSVRERPLFSPSLVDLPITRIHGDGPRRAKPIRFTIVSPTAGGLGRIDLVVLSE